jgi:hypothetical protein
MTSIPGVLGGKLRGYLETGGEPSTGEVELVLDCVSWRRGYRSGSSEILWQDGATVVLSPGAGGGQAVVEFDIPFDARATGDYGPGNVERVFWRLTARSTAGAFHASFTVPVFPTAESDSSRTRERLDAQAGSRLSGYAPAPSRIEKAVTPEGIRYHFPSGRSRSMAALTSLFGLVFLGIAFVLAMQANSWPALGAIVGAVFASLIGLLLLIAGVWLLFAETMVTTLSGELRIHSSCLGISHTRILHAAEIRGFDIKPGMQRGTAIWYDVWMRDVAGKSTNAGTGMDKTEAEWFVAEIRKDLGLS